MEPRHQRGGAWLGALCAGAVLSFGCVGEAQYDAAAYELQQMRAANAVRAQENAALYWRQAALVHEIQLRDAQLREVATAQQFVRKLEELMALNSDLAKRLSNAEHALEELSVGRKDGGAPQRAQAELDEIRSFKRDADDRTAAYEKLIRNVQHLVDSGRIKAVVREGHVQFTLPRTLDQSDPWK